MNLEDFKFIYWMEYAHRMWGRGLGIMFALSFSYFMRKGYITLRLGVQLSGLFALGAGQGFIGRWMVKSGLEELPSEYSQPKLSHWLGFGEQLKVKRLVLPVSFIVGITAISGAFVAGNDAGRAFNTFPKMGDTWIPDGIFEMKPLIRNFFENTATVQLDHRLLATTTLLAIGTMWWFTRKLDIHPAVKALIGSTVGMTAVQVTLGVSTLLSYVPVSLGSAHQAGALTLLTLMLLLNHTLRRPSPSLLKSLPQVAKSNFS
ncbi:cytochrome c oxidase assembly protein COX15-like isoform X3 [Brassica napus]|uniref:cytochrome c oxidase assembly protein COX15-like isoform X3 n=1 Tax=Brassica napus TaxID=3708 RepID=UPI002078E3B0|nr:cytochrome c oxidase assembly protein COX15-like isoform X3 [Brassica napus]